MKNNLSFLARILNTEPPDTYRYSVAQRLFKELVVRERIARSNQGFNEYMPDIPHLETPKYDWSEAVRHAFKSGISVMTI